MCCASAEHAVGLLEASRLGSCTDLYILVVMSEPETLQAAYAVSKGNRIASARVWMRSRPALHKNKITHNNILNILILIIFNDGSNDNDILE